jgi:PAS domain S-box-containing protein
MLYVKDTSGRFQVVNQALARLLGLASPDAVIGKSDFDFFPRELAAQYQADEQSLIESGAVLHDKEELVFDSDGTERWLLTTKVPLRNREGKLSGSSGVARILLIARSPRWSDSGCSRS